MAKEFKNSTLRNQGAQRVALGIQESDETAMRFSLWNVKKVYNVKDFGALGDGVTDDTTAIQNTINDCHSNGGGTVLFPDGIYVVGGALQTAVSQPDGAGGTENVNYNSQLYIPNPDLIRDVNRSHIYLKGETRQNFTTSGGVGTNIPSETGAIILSTIQGSGTKPSILATKGRVGDPFNENFTDLSIADIGFRVTPSGTDQITIGGINAFDSKNLFIDRITIMPFNYNLVDIALPAEEASGIIMPEFTAEQNCQIRNTVVGGFYHGYEVQGHARLDDVSAMVCLRGYRFNTSQAMMSKCTKIQSLWNETDVIVDPAATKAYFNIELYIEHSSTDTGQWYYQTHSLRDPSDVGHGMIWYHITDGSGSSANGSFIKTNGANIRCLPIAHEAASSYTITGAKGGNVALTDLLTKLQDLGIIIDSTT